MGKSIREVGKAYKDTKNELGDSAGIKDFWKTLFPSTDKIVEKEKVVPELISKEKAQEYLDTIELIDQKKYGEIDSYQKYFDSLSEGKKWIAQYAQASKDQIRTTDDVVAANIKANTSAQSYNHALYEATFQAKATNLALKGLTLVANMAISALAGFIISKTIEWFDNYIHRVERTKEALEESISAYKNVQSEIDNLNKQLEEIDTQIESINSLGGAQVSKDGELEKLESQRQALEANLALKKEEAYLDAKKAADDAYDSFTQTVDNPYSKPVVVGMDDGEAITRNQVTSQEQAVKDAIAAWNSYEKELQNVNAQIIQTKSEMDTLADNSAERSVKENELKSLESRKASLENDMDDAREYANKNMQNALEAKNAYALLTKDGQQLTETQKDQKKSVDALSAVYDRFVDRVQNTTLKTPEVDTSATEKSLEKVKLFSIEDEETSKEIDDFQSKMSTLKSALQNIEDLKFSNSDLVDLEQQFPELTNASGDLSTAIKKLINESLSSLVAKFKEAGASDDLLNLLQSIANEAQGIASTDWIGTFDVFDSADSKLQSLAEMIVDLGNSYTLTATEARKYAEIFPDLLAQGQITANGLIQFNSDVVNDYVAGQQATVAADTDAQITRLENEKSVLEAKKAAAEAAIAIINGQITDENEGSHKIADIRKNLAQYLIDLGVEEQTANATAMELMAGNVSEYDRVVSDVSENVNNNLSGAIQNAGINIARQAKNMIDNLFKIGKQASNTGEIIANFGKEPIEAVKEDAIGSISSIYNFKKTQADAKFVKGESHEISVDIFDDVLGDLQLKVDDYTKGIEALDSQITLLKSKRNKAFDDYLKDAKDKASKKNSGDKDKETDFDWIKQKLDAVRASYEDLLAEFNDSDNVYSTQLNFLDAAIEKQKQLIDLEKLAVDAYTKEWDSASAGLSDDIKEKIMFGEIDIDKYKGNDKLTDQITKAKEAWSTLSEMAKQLASDQKTLEDNEKSRYTKSIEWKQSEIDDLKEKADIEQTSYEKNIDLMNQAIKKSEELVAAEKQHAEETKSAWEEVRDQLKPEDVAALMDGKADFEQYAEIDPAYYELFKKGDLLYSEYLDSVKKLQEGELNLQETRKQAYEKGIEYIQKQRDAISGLNDKVQAEMDLVEQLGGITTEGMYRELIDNSKDMMELYESEVDKIKGRMEKMNPNSSEYYELLSNLQSCETSLIECQKNQAEWNEAIIRLPIERIQKYLNELANIKQDLNNFLSQKSSVGIATNKEQYQQLISIDQAQIDKYTEQQKKLQNLLKNYKYGSEKFNETSSEIQEIDNAISDLIVEMQDYNYQIARIPVDNLQKVVDTLDNAQTSIENLTAQQDARGIDTTIDQYQTMIDIASKRIEVLSTQRQMLVQLQSQFEKGSDRYTEIGSEIQDIDNTISGLIVNQYEWNKAMLQIPIDKLSNVNDELSAYSSILSDVLSEYDSALSGVTGTIDEQIDKINELRDATEKEYEEKIKPLQDELDLLEKTNEARSVQIALENAQYELDKARQQKKTQVVRNGQLTYENDPDEIRDKQQALQDAEYNKAKYDLQKQIDSLEEERDALLESYDNQLDSLNKIKDKWSEITDQIQLAADKAKAENLFGAGWEDKVLSGNDDDLYNMFKNLYTATSEQKDKVDEQISSNERIADMMQIYADRFQSGAMTYDQAMAGINSLATSMKDGYSALENLGDLMKADNIADLGSIASSATNKISESLTDLSSIMERVKNNYSTMDPATWEEVKHDVKEQAKASESLSASMNEFNQYLGTFKENTEAINKYTKTWDDMRDDLQSQLESLKKAAEALEKMSSSSSSGRKHSSSGGSSSSSKESSGTTDVYYHGHYAYSSDSKGNAYDKNGNSVNKSDAWNSAKDYVNEKKNYTKKHDGIASGLVGNNKTMSDNERESRFKKLGMRELDTNEIWVKALRDEVVLTKGQQETLLKNFDASMNVGIRTGAAIGMPTVQPSKQVMNDVVNVEIGDINVHDVGDVNGFAKAVKTQIKPIMTQTFSRR